MFSEQILAIIENICQIKFQLMSKRPARYSEPRTKTDFNGLRIHNTNRASVMLFETDTLSLVTSQVYCLSESSFHQYQPVKNLDNGATLIYLTLDYKAQLYFVKQNWKITLLGSTLSICDPDKRERTSPDITQDLGNVESMGLEDQNK